MNELKNYHCLSKAKYRGLDNMQIQAYIAAVVINIKRLVNFLLFSVTSHYMIKNSASFTTGRYLIYLKVYHRLIDLDNKLSFLLLNHLSQFAIFCRHML